MTTECTCYIHHNAFHKHTNFFQPYYTLFNILQNNVYSNYIRTHLWHACLYHFRPAPGVNSPEGLGQNPGEHGRWIFCAISCSENVSFNFSI